MNYMPLTYLVDGGDEGLEGSPTSTTARFAPTARVEGAGRVDEDALAEVLSRIAGHVRSAGLNLMPYFRDYDKANRKAVTKSQVRARVCGCVCSVCICACVCVRACTCARGCACVCVCVRARVCLVSARACARGCGWVSLLGIGGAPVLRAPHHTTRPVVLQFASVLVTLKMVLPRAEVDLLCDAFTDPTAADKVCACICVRACVRVSE